MANIDFEEGTSHLAENPDALVSWQDIEDAFNDKVSTSRTINSKPLTSDIVLNATDIVNTPAGNISSATVQGAINELSTLTGGLGAAADAVPVGLALVTPSGSGLTIGAGGAQTAWVALTWTALSTTTFSYYQLGYKKATATYYSYVNAKTNYILIDNLVPNLSYNFIISSVNKSGVASAFSSPLTLTTPADSTKPAQVASVTATAGTGVITLRWTANSESDLDLYIVYRNTSNSHTAETTLATCKTNFFSDTSVVVETPYFYWVKAKDTSGNISDSYSIVVTTTAANLDFSDITDGAIIQAMIDIGTINPVSGEINENTIGTLQLADNAVEEGNILDGAIKAAKLDIDAIGGDGRLSPLSVYWGTIDTNAVDEAAILNGAIKEAKIDDNAVTANKILAGSVLARHIVSYNFIVDGPTDTFTTGPGAGEIQWVECSVWYEGIEYVIAAGHAEAGYKHVYWEYEANTFSTSTTLDGCSLGNDDYLVAYNDAGTPRIIWNSTVINGNRITTGSITASNIQAGTITALELNADTITAIKIAAESLAANRISVMNFQLLGALTTITGSINPTNDSTTVTGSGTTFTTEVAVGDYLVVSGETRTVVNITSNEVLTIDEAFSDDLATDSSPQIVDWSADIEPFVSHPLGNYISWLACLVRYDGICYPIALGECLSTDTYVYWEYEANVFSCSANLPNLGNDDYIVATNGDGREATEGTVVYTWNSTKINGNRITTGTITASQLAAKTITANEIAAGSITSTGDIIAAGAILGSMIGANEITANHLDVTGMSVFVAGEGGTYVTSTSNPALRIFPSANIGLEVLDASAGNVLTVMVGGTDVGDVIIGNYTGGHGIKFDSSADETYFEGNVTADSGTIGGWSINPDYIYHGTPVTGDGYATNVGDITLHSNGSIHTKNFYVNSDGEAAFTGLVNGLDCKIIEMGDWDMDATVTYSVVHGIADFTKIRSVSAFIRSDTSLGYAPLNMVDPTTGHMGGSVGVFDNTVMNLSRTTGGMFDNASFDSVSFNRGWVVIYYAL